MKSLFYLTILLLQTGRLITVPIWETSQKTAPLTLTDLAMALLLLGYTYRMIFLGRLPLVGVPRAGLVFLFLVWAGISLLMNVSYYGLSPSQGLFSALYLGRWFEYTLFYFITYELFRNRLKIRGVVYWLTAAGLAYCVFGVVQAAFLPNFAFIVHPDARPWLDYDVQGHRLVSTFLDPNISCTYISIFALISLSFYLHGFRRWKYLFAIFSLGVLLTLSRGGILGFLCGVLLLTVLSEFGRKRAVAAILGMAILALSLYPVLESVIETSHRLQFDDVSAVSRIEQWQLAYEVARDNVVFGIGFNTAGFILPRYGRYHEGASSFGLSGDLLMICMLTGIIGLGIYLLLFRKLGVVALTLRRRSPDAWDKALAVGVLAAGTSILGNGFFTSVILYPQIMAVFWMLWAMLERLLQKLPATQVRTYPPPVKARVPVLALSFGKSVNATLSG